MSFAVTKAQEGIWAWRETHPTSAASTVLHVVPLDGLTDDVVRARLRELADRHQSLRTTFHVDAAGELRQTVHEPGAATVTERIVDDLRPQLESLRHHRFDVGTRCWSADLVTSPNGRALVFAADALVFDQAATAVLEAELAGAGAPVGVQPVEAAVAQRELLRDADRLRGHWTSAMAGYRDEMRLPEPLTRHGDCPEQQDRVIDPRVVERLRRTGPLFGTVLAALKAFLHRRGLGPDNVVSVATVATGTISHVANLVPIRDTVDDEKPFDAYLRGLTGTLDTALAHGSWPFQEIVRSLRGATPPSRVVVAQTSTPLADVPVNSMYDLTVLVDLTDGLALRWVAGAPVLDGTLHRFAEGFAAFLGAIAVAPRTSIGALPVMGAEEEKLVAETLRAPEPAHTATLLDLFDSQVSRQPHAPAVIIGDHRVTYQELARRSDALAAAAAPADQDAPVVVALEKSADLVAALLAALRLGSFYLPLAPDHASTRLADLVRRSGARVVITRTPVLTGVELPDDVRILLLDEDIPSSPAPRSAAVGPDSLAYVMPTSGTSGVPKLVGVPHRAVVRLVHSNLTIPLGPVDRTMLVANSSFDAATLEVWGALGNGGAIVVPEPHELTEPAALCAAIERHAVTAGFFTVTLFARMLAANPRRLAGMRHLLVGGEAVPPALFAEAERHVPRHALMNGYGPTENTTFSCCHRLDRDPAAVRSIPVGRAMHGSRSYVLDDRLRPVPVGVAGEIVVAGAGLAVGYLNDPELTAQRFPAHPWASDERVYRTGDYGRLLPDGTIEYLGRRDNQLKIRGFRIETGEVEHVLDAHPDVRRSVAFGLDTPSGRQLAAAAETSDVDENGLRSWMSGRLPGYAVPARLLVVRELPLTSNGKIDVPALEAMLRDRVKVAREAPASATERTVMDVWREVLGIARLGVDEDLFALGADSVSVLTVATRLGKLMRRPIPSHLVFEHRTARALASRLTDGAAERDRQALLRRVSAVKARR